MGESANGPSVVGTETDKFSHLMRIGGLWPLLDCFHFLWVSADSVLSDEVAQKLHLFPKEVAFLWRQLQLCCPQPLEHLLQIFDLLLRCSPRNKDVVNVHQGCFWW